MKAKRSTIRTCMVFTMSLLMILSTVFCCGCAGKQDPAENQPEAEQQFIGLPNVLNARQLGGYINKEGYKIKDNMLIRSGSFGDAQTADLRKLFEKCDLKYMFDLRTTGEKEKNPDIDVEGVEIRRLDIINSVADPDMEVLSSLISEADNAPEDVDRTIYLCRNPEYVSRIGHQLEYIAQSEDAQLAYFEMFYSMLESEGGAVLWHSTLGKDRAGFAAILILSALDVDREVIKQDYLMTDSSFDERVSALQETGKAEGFSEDQLKAIEYTESVSEDCFDRLMALIDGQYGGMHSYLNNQIGLSDVDISLLQDYYLEK